MKVLVETSARHLHISQKDLETLFGAGFELVKKKDLSQPGEFATEQRVKVIGQKGELVVTILGPTRPATQIEISATDARSIGVAPVIRQSGDVAGTPGCKMVAVGGTGVELELAEGVIVAQRHLHATPEDAATLNVVDKEIVCLKIEGENRTTLFGDVVVRVNKNYATAVHIDTDESNASNCPRNAMCEIVK